MGARSRRLVTGVLALAVLAIPAFAQPATLRPHLDLTADVATVTVGEQRLSASLTNAELTLSTPFVDVTLSPAIQLGDGWTQPSRAVGRAKVARTDAHVHVTIVYPVPEAREFLLELDAYRDLPAVFVTSRLKALSGPRGQYYFWQTNVGPVQYAAPGAKGPETRPFDAQKWHALDWAEWWFLPVGKGGLAVLPTNCGGRAPGAGGNVFLHALPRSTVLAAGDSLDASFGLAGVADAGAAERVSAQAHARHVPALEPWARDTGGRWDYGRPAPRWLREAGCYNLYYRPAEQWTEPVVRETLRLFPFTIGSTPDRAALEKCHGAGVRLLHYVVYTCLLDTELQVRGGGTVYSEWRESIDCESRDLKDHPDWVCIQTDGRPRHDPWGQQHGHPGLLNTCLHQPGLQEAALRQVRMLMERGFDGVFIDLAGPVEECYGPKFGKHTHPDGARTNSEAYEELLRRVYRTVKRFGDDRVVIQNTCVCVLPSHWSYTDGQMLEAYPWGSESASRLTTWPELRWAAARHGQAARHGKAPVILPYFSKLAADQARGPALFSYAYARLHDFLFADALTLSEIPGNREFADALYRVRLGEPVHAVEPCGEALYRRFRHGLALLNPTKSPLSVTIPLASSEPLNDLGYGRTLSAVDGALHLELAPESGRVLVSPGEGRP